MDSTRRGFLKIAGLSLLGLGAKPVVDAIASSGGGRYQPDPKTVHGKRWGMVIDQRKLAESPTAIDDAIKACHTSHNVPDLGNPKDEVKWIWKAHFHNAFPGSENEFADIYYKEGLKDKPFLVLCNHCDNPPCVRVCPVKATFRREDGIVMMDYHRCIGCRFCMAACPYGARSLNWRDPIPFIKTELNKEYPTRTRGVVEKCNFCVERLEKGLKPACVDACKNKEIIFGDLEDPKSEVREILRKHPTIRRKPHLGTQPQVFYIV